MGGVVIVGPVGAGGGINPGVIVTYELGKNHYAPYTYYSLVR